MKTRRALITIGAVAILGAVAPLSPSAAWHADGPSNRVTVTKDCFENQAFVNGDAAAVKDRLPSGYTAVTNVSSGDPLLFVRALRCNLEGYDGPVTFASYGIVVESPDGTHCGPSTPVDAPPVCNWYVLSWVASDLDLVQWLRESTPDFPITYVRELEFEQGQASPTDGGAPFHFEASHPAPSPFTIEAVGRERPGTLRVRGAYWAEVNAGTVRIGFSTDELVSGDATGTVTAAPKSELAMLMGAESAPYELGYSAIGAERWPRAFYRKQITGPAHNVSTFEGSCAAEGTVTFEPGVTLIPQPLTYDFEGEAVCNGTLNGTEVKDAVVTMHQGGRSEGNCASARTTSPGPGAIRFSTGETIAYNIDFTFQGGQTDMVLWGSRSGKAPGKGTFRTDRTPPDAAAPCATTGIKKIPMDITFTTDTPLVSDRR